jgi:hypothetical protein
MLLTTLMLLVPLADEWSLLSDRRGTPLLTGFQEGRDEGYCISKVSL